MESGFLLLRESMLARKKQSEVLKGFFSLLWINITLPSYDSERIIEKMWFDLTEHDINACLSQFLFLSFHAKFPLRLNINENDKQRKRYASIEQRNAVMRHLDDFG